MYLIETSFTSQSVTSDTHPYKSVPRSNGTEGTSKEALAIRVFTNHVRTSHHKKSDVNLYTVATRCRDIRQVVLSFSQISGLHTGLQMLSIRDVSLFGMGYMTQRSSPG